MSFQEVCFLDDLPSGRTIGIDLHLPTYRHKWRVDCGSRPTKLFFKVFLPILQQMLLKMNKWIFRLLNHLAYARFPWASALNQTVNVGTIPIATIFFISLQFKPMAVKTEQCSELTDITYCGALDCRNKHEWGHHRFQFDHLGLYVGLRCAFLLPSYCNLGCWIVQQWPLVFFCTRTSFIEPSPGRIFFNHGKPKVDGKLH